MRFYLVIVGLMTFAMVNGPLAFAQAKKRIQLDVKERVKDKKSKKAKLESRRSAVIAINIEKKLIKGIEKTTEYLSKTAQGMPKKSPDRLQILEKVLNLYMENATYLRNEEERSYDQGWRQWDAAGRKTKEPTLNSARSNNYWKKVIAEATKINNEYPRNKTADIVLFNKAIGLNYIGREKDAARILSELVTKYKGSNVAGDAYSSLGDYYFDRNDFRNAQNNYSRATKYPRSKRYLWSIFKLGWCSYNLGRYRKAMDFWKSVVAKSREPGAVSINIREEALRDLVYAFAELREVDSAIAYYRANNGSQYIGTFLMLLGEIFSEQGKYKQSIKVYQKFQNTVPFAEEAPTAQKEIISIYYITNNLRMVWNQLSVFYNRYGPASPWSKHNAKLSKDTNELIKDQMMYYATITHQKAIKDNNRNLNLAARQGYLLYLQSFPKSPEVPGVKFLLADIEYYLKNYEKAGQYYFEIASLGKAKALRFNPQTKKFENIHNESSVEMVGAYVKDFGPEFKVLKKTKPNFKKPTALSKKASNYIRACENYVKWYPGDKARVKTCTSAMATIYYHSGMKERALVYLTKVAETYSADPDGKDAVALVIPLVKDDKKKLAELTERFLKIPAYAKGKIGDMLRQLRRAAETENILSEKNKLIRAKKLEAQAKKYPNTPDVVSLWNNAAIDYMEGGAIKDAIRAHTFIVNRHSKSPQAKESLLIIAMTQEKIFEYPQASGSYLAFSSRYPQSKEALTALSKSCGLLVAINSPKATAVCLNFARKAPDYATGHIESMIRGAYLAKQYSHMVNLITKVYLPSFNLSANQQIVAWHRIYEAYRGQGALAQTARQNMIATYQKASGSVSGQALRAIGTFYFAQSIPVLKRFHSIKLRGGTVDNLLQSIQAKASALQQLQQGYGQILSIKDAYSGVASYVALGEANEELGEALSHPPGINGAKNEDVVKQLAGQAAEYKKGAAEFYNLAMQTVSQYSVYSPSSVKAISGLARAKGRNFSFDDYIVTPDFVGNEVTSQWVSELRSH